MHDLAAKILSRIERNRHTTEAGSFLLGDPASRLVYVLAEASNTAAGQLKRHASWWAGQYAQGVAAVLPIVDDILEDLRCHFSEPHA